VTFLKTLGSIILKATQIVLGFAPIAQSAFPSQAGTIQTVEDKLQQIANIIVQTEAIGQALTLTGAQKLTAAAPLVAQEILSSSLLVGHQIADAAKFQTAVSGIASNMADLLNSLKADAIQTQNKVA
jgi:hypothetical protein